jgi:hypothetical protein
MRIMKTTSEVSCTSKESTAMIKFSREKSLKACVAGWTLEKAKDVTLPEIKEYKMT